MKYDCEFIRDVATLYRDGSLSDRGAAIVEEHLAECPDCSRYFAQYAEPALPKPDVQSTEDFTPLRRISQYRAWQAGVFALLAAALLSMLAPWFGQQGINEIAGTTVLRHPAAIVGLALFCFGIWYAFKKKRARVICGGVGCGLIVLCELFDFLSIPFGYTAGIAIPPFYIDLPSFSGFSLAECFSNARAGFYIGLLLTAAAGIAFGLFVKKTSLKS